jgi:uncharacterized protein (DUF983 family)
MSVKSNKSIFFLRCPTCGKGKLFKSNPYKLKNMLDMNHRCEYCNEDFEVEPGFYFGAMYVSYILTTALCLMLLPIYIAFNYTWEKFLDNAAYYIIGCAVALIITTPYITQLSRAIWLKVHILYFKKKE